MCRAYGAWFLCITDPALTRWANLWRTTGAGEKYGLATSPPNDWRASRMPAVRQSRAGGTPALRTSEACSIRQRAIDRVGGAG
jgi:hypothetical protein